MQSLLSLQRPISKKVCYVRVYLKFISLSLGECALVCFLIEFGGTSGIAFGKIKRQYAFG